MAGYERFEDEALAQRQARGRVSDGLCHAGRVDGRPGRILCLLQRRAPAPVAGPTDARCHLSNRCGWRGGDAGQIRRHVGAEPTSNF